jgi:hypothetical protein
MPVLDDELLGALFTEAGTAFEVPASGMVDIARAARGDDGGAVGPAQLSLDLGPAGGPPLRRTLGGTIGAHRLLAVAACLIVVVGIAVVGLSLRRGAPGTRSAASVAAGPAVPSTTLPVAHAPAFSTLSPPAGTATGSLPAPGTPSAGTSQRLSVSTPGAATSSADAGQSSKIEQTGSLSLQVPAGALSSTITKLTTLALDSHGFVAHSQTKAGGAAGTAPVGSITLQVPEASFPIVLRQAQALGKSLQLTTRATDVTGQYVDLQSRITALQASRQQYLTILARATTISDILAVQAQLDSLQSQIEQLQGEFQVLTNETTYSTLTVAVHELAPAHRHASGPPTGIDRAWHDSLHGFAAGVDGGISLAGPALFALLCAVLAVLAGRLLWRRWQRHNL